MGDALTKKYGPLPGSVWLLLVFCVGFIFLRSRKSGSAAAGNNNSWINGQDNKVTFQTSSSVWQDFSNKNTGDGTLTVNSNNKTDSGNVTKTVTPKVVKVVQPRHYPRLDHWGHDVHYRHNDHHGWR